MLMPSIFGEDMFEVSRSSITAQRTMLRRNYMVTTPRTL